MRNKLASQSKVKMVVNTLSAITAINNKRISALALLLLRLFQYNNFALNSVFNFETASFMIIPNQIFLYSNCNNHKLLKLIS